MKKDSADGEGGASATPETRDSTPEQRKDAARALDPAADSVKETLSSPGVPTSEMKQQQQKKKQQQQQQQQQNEQPQKQLKQQPEETSSEGEAATEAEGEDGTKKKRATGPMDAVLHMEPPERQPEETRPPHLSPAPYVHHFDSYSLVKQLEDGGYTNAQAITAMKAVRAILAQNLDVAQGGLISKSDVENETYLFRAACAELSTEVKNSQRIADEQLRQQRTVLQHEMDNTTQTLNQELLTLNDNVRGMFNDRKMAVREEQKAAESMVRGHPFPSPKMLAVRCLLDPQIQQIAYKISVTLNSDSKSEIEAVRWELARRAVLGIVFMVTLSLAMLRYGSYVSQVDKKEAQREKEESEALRRSGGKIDGAQGPDAAEILAAN